MSINPLVSDKGLNVVNDGDDHSVLLIQVHKKHQFGKNELVGCSSGIIGGMLGRLKDGGTVMLELTCFADMIAMVKMLKATISLDPSDGPDLSENIILFALATKPPTEVDSDEHQALGTVTMVTKMVAALHTPAVV